MWGRPSVGIRIALLGAVFLLLGVSAAAFHMRGFSSWGKASSDDLVAEAGAIALLSAETASSVPVPAPATEETSVVVPSATETSSDVVLSPAVSSVTPSVESRTPSSPFSVSSPVSSSKPVASIPSSATAPVPVVTPPVPSQTTPIVSDPPASKPIPSVTPPVKPAALHIRFAIGGPHPFAFTVDVSAGSTVETAMQKARSKKLLTYTTSVYSGLGTFIESIQGVTSDKKAGLYWSYKVNGVFASVGVSSYKLSDGDLIFWRYGPMP